MYKQTSTTIGSQRALLFAHILSKTAQYLRTENAAFQGYIYMKP